MGRLEILSSAFSEGEMIPRRYTCEGDNINPPLEVYGMPEDTKSIAIIMDDPDAPAGLFTHWLAWNLPPDIIIPEGRQHQMTGTNSAGIAKYFGPCPPKDIHRYYFRVYALKKTLSLNNGAGREELQAAIEENLLSAGSLMGRYERRSV